MNPESPITSPDQPSLPAEVMAQVIGGDLAELNAGGSGGELAMQAGDTIGMWLLLYPGVKESGRRRRKIWLCRCRCLTIREVDVFRLQNGRSLSCGCAQYDALRRLIIHEYAGEHNSWRSIRARCLNPRDKAYGQYGGRGITICDRWVRSFEAFLSDVGPRPSPQHSLDRYPDHNGNYELGNVRWATATDQARNRRDNRLLSLGGRSYTAAEWTEKQGLPKNIIASRHQSGWTDEAALMRPPGVAHGRCSRRGASGFLGVQRCRGRWTARIMHEGQYFSLRTYATPEEAARAYDAKARELLGPHAVVNFPEESRP